MSNLLFRFRTWDNLLEIAQRQQKTIHKQRVAILEMHREMLDMATAWRISIESPELDIRDDVSGIITTLRDKIAQMEEHSV